MIFLIKLKRFIVAILPPVIFNFGQVFLYKLKGKDVRKTIKEQSVIEIPSEYDATYGDFNKIYNIPVEKLFHYGGQPFNSVDQPFYNYLINGEESLKKYYENHQPSNCFDAHKVDINDSNSKAVNYKL